MPSQSPSSSPRPATPNLGQDSHNNQALVEHLAAEFKLAQEQEQEAQEQMRRAQTPNPDQMSGSVGDLDDDEADDDGLGYSVKRPRTPSSVPPMPVSRVPQLSAKIIKSTESLHVPNSPRPWKVGDKDDIITLGGGGGARTGHSGGSNSSSMDRSPLRSKYTVGGGGDQQFCLKWNSYQTNLSKEFDDLLQNESFVDVTLACDGHSVKAHKMVLSACSPYFQALFFDNPCQHPIIIMKEVKWPELKAVVEYMYRGEINVCRDQIEPLLRVANMLKIRGLTDVDQYLNAPSPDENEPPDSAATAAKVSRKSPKIDCLQSKANGDEGFSKNVQDKFRELVDINENVEKVFLQQQQQKQQHHHHLHYQSQQQQQQQHRDNADGLNRVSPANSSSRLSDSENKCGTPVRGGGGGSGISVRDRDHLMPPDSPSALTAAVAAAQDRLNRQNLATRKRRWMTGDGGSPSSSSAENHQLTNRSSSSPDNAENLRESPSTLLAMQNANALQLLQQQQQQQQQQGHHLQQGAGNNSAVCSGGATVGGGGVGGIGAGNNASSSSSTSGAQQQQQQLPFSLPHSTLESMGLSATALGLPPSTNADDMEIKPGIAEMIREEERAKLLESSHAWLGASTSSIADSYQYQLQSMWQKCWNTNHNMVHQLRFRERGPLKSWRPETMAEAIFSVLKEGLSLSQAARKYDIPYPTFVLYANRVHNMLGPSMDGGTDLRPKGRGRPQRILLGLWPDDHIRAVIKTVVFRDAKDLKEEVGVNYDRQSKSGTMGYPVALSNGLGPNSLAANQQAGNDAMSNDAAAAAVAAVAHGIRQQMQMVAAAQNYSDAANLVSGLNHLNMYPTNNGGSANNMPMPKIGSPATSGLTISSNLVNTAGSAPHRSGSAQHPGHLQSPHLQRRSPSGLNITRINSPSTSIHDMRIQSPDGSSLNSSMELALEPAVNLAVGVSGFKSTHRQYLHDDLADLVSGQGSGRQRMGNQQGSSGSGGQSGGGIKMEPVGECRGD